MSIQTIESIYEIKISVKECFEKKGKGILKFIHIFLYAFNVAMRID